MRRARAMAVTGLVGAVLLVGACGSDDNSSDSASEPAESEQPAFVEADANTVVHVKSSEYRFEFDNASPAGKKVFFEVTNGGKEEHEFEILRSDGEAVDEIEGFPAGETKTLAVELDPGTYTAQCILETTDAKKHSDLGMTTTFKVS